MSLLLCTARSISLSEQRVLDLLDEQPLAADLRQATSCSWSPDVLMTTMRHAGPPDSAIRAATVRACHSASWLPRVPSRSSESPCSVPVLGSG